MVSVLLLIAGFVLLVKGADWFVGGSSSVAKTFHIPSVIIGLTIVALGTSAPEAAVSITAALNESNGIALGNVIGSNLFNLLVVAGISAVIVPIKVEKVIIKRDYPYSIFGGILLLIFVSIPVLLGITAEMSLSRIGGVVLLIICAVYLYVIVKATLKEQKEEKANIISGTLPLWQSGIMIVLGIIGIVAGGQFVVNGATDIAEKFGLSENLIGLTIVAIGTSLPELVTSIVAAKKGESDIAMGNVIGSNIFNIFFVLGASAAIHPITVNMYSVYDMIVFIAVSIIFFLPIIKNKKIGRLSGIFMVLTYAVYDVFIILR